MVVRALPFLFLLLFSACVRNGPSAVFDPHLGTKTYRSSMHVAGRTPLWSTNVRAVIVTAGSASRHALPTYVARTDLNYPKITAAWSLGQKMPYRKIDRQRAGALRAEAGTIPMTAAGFRHAAENGMSFRLYGPRETYRVTVPAHLFAGALTAAAAG